jgi:hypothetical protein
LSTEEIKRMVSTSIPLLKDGGQYRKVILTPAGADLNTIPAATRPDTAAIYERETMGDRCRKSWLR